MKCPNCGAEGPAGGVECAACGVIFAKFKKKLEPKLPPPSKFNPWKGRLIAAVIVALWIVSFALYYRGVVSGMRVRNPSGPTRRR